MLAKEQSITVLDVCFILDLFDGRGFKDKTKSLLRLAFSLIMIMSLQIVFLGGQLPSFSKADNPASHSLDKSFNFLVPFSFQCVAFMSLNFKL